MIGPLRCIHRDIGPGIAATDHKHPFAFKLPGGIVIA